MTVVPGTRKLTEEGARRHLVVTRAVLNGATFDAAGALVGVGKGSSLAIFRATLRRARAVRDDGLLIEVAAHVTSHRLYKEEWLASLDALEKKWFP